MIAACNINSIFYEINISGGFLGDLNCYFLKFLPIWADNLQNSTLLFQKISVWDRSPLTVDGGCGAYSRVNLPPTHSSLHRLKAYIQTGNFLITPPGRSLSIAPASTVSYNAPLFFPRLRNNNNCVNNNKVKYKVKIKYNKKPVV